MFFFHNISKLATGIYNCILLAHTFMHYLNHSLFHSRTHLFNCNHSLVHSRIFTRFHSLTYSRAHLFTHSFFHSLTLMCTTDCHLLDHTLKCNHSQAVTNKIFVAFYIGMIASTVIAVKVRSWIGVPTMCNLLLTDSFAEIGLLRTGAKLS